MKTLRAFPLLVLGLALPATAADHTPPPVQLASAFAAVEVHADEQVSIAVEPYDTKEKASIFRVDYLSHDVMPVRLIVTNLGDKPISLRDERLMTRKERQGGKIPLPTPLPPIHTKAKGSNKEIEADFNTFEYSALAVEPHTTRAGFLFYDVSGLSHPLVGASLYLRKLRNADGNELFSFEIPFNKYLKSKSGQMN